MNNEATLGIWPKTGHRLVRALDDQTCLFLYGPSGGDDEGRFNVASYSDDDAMGQSITFFVVAPGDSVSLFKVVFDVDYMDAHAGITRGRVASDLDNGLLQSALRVLPKTDFNMTAGWGSGLIDPGPFVPKFDVSMYALLGLPLPWLLPRAELAVMLEGLNE